MPAAAERATRRQVLLTLCLVGALVLVVLIPSEDRIAEGDSEKAAAGARQPGSGEWVEYEGGMAARSPVAGSEGGTPVPAGPERTIVGRVEYVGPTEYRPDFSDVRLLVSPGSMVEPFESGTGFDLGAVRGDGSFEIPVETGQGSLELAAVGPGAATWDDIQAVPGQEVVLHLDALFGFRFQLIDAATQELQYSDFIPPRGGIHTGFYGKGTIRRSIASSLASAYFESRFPELTTLPHTHLVCVSGENSPQPEFRVRFAKTGYVDLSESFAVPLLLEMPPILAIQVERDRSSRIQDIWVDVARSGPWTEYSATEYRSVARAVIATGGGEGAVATTGDMDLRPGTRRLIGAPADISLVTLRLMTKSNFVSPSAADREIETRWESRPNGMHVFVDNPSVGAIGIRSVEADPHAHAWIGLMSESLTSITGVRYDLATGLVLDGLIPGDYDLYWSADRVEFKRMAREELPVMTLRIRPGLQAVVLPE